MKIQFIFFMLKRLNLFNQTLTKQDKGEQGGTQIKSASFFRPQRAALIGRHMGAV